MPSMTDRVCPYCGQPTYETMTLFGHTMQMPKLCDCEQAREERRREAKQAEEREQQQKREQFLHKLEMCGVPKRYLEAKHPDSKQYAQDVANGKSLYVTGNVGVGKTHLTYSIVRKLVYNRIKVKCMTEVDMMIRIQATYDRENPEAEADLIRELSNVDVLVIEDAGKGMATKWTLTRLYTIINNRYNNLKPVIVTSNHRISQWAQHLASVDESTAEAIASRLAEMCEVITVEGEDRRLQ